MKRNKPKKLIAIIALIIIVPILFLMIESVSLKKAHSTFENYYKFRGCTELIEKTDDYGTCKIRSGETIKIVKYQGKWFLDGDLPSCLLCF